MNTLQKIEAIESLDTIMAIDETASLAELKARSEAYTKAMQAEMAWHGYDLTIRWVLTLTDGMEPGVQFEADGSFPGDFDDASEKYQYANDAVKWEACMEHNDAAAVA